MLPIFLSKLKFPTFPEYKSALEWDTLIEMMIRQNTRNNFVDIFSFGNVKFCTFSFEIGSAVSLIKKYTTWTVKFVLKDGSHWLAKAEIM